MRISDSENNVKKSIDGGRITTMYIDTGDFGKQLYVKFKVVLNDKETQTTLIENWDAIIYCAATPNKMSRELSHIYVRYISGVLKYSTKTIVPERCGDDAIVFAMRYALEEYIWDRVFKRNVSAVIVDELTFEDVAD